MEPLILDASVLIGLLDSADAYHAQAIQDTEAADHAGRALLIPASAYSEALVAFARANRIEDAREAIAAMVSWSHRSQRPSPSAPPNYGRHDRCAFPMQSLSLAHTN